MPEYRVPGMAPRGLTETDVRELIACLESILRVLRVAYSYSGTVSDTDPESA